VLLGGQLAAREDGLYCMAKGTFGERLKRERELREVTLEEVSTATRISVRFLEALENEDWARLPGGVFGRGFVRTIARYLGLSEESLLAEYDLARGENQIAPPSKPEERIPSPPKWIPIVAVLIILLLMLGLVLAGLYVWKKYKARKQAGQVAKIELADAPARRSSAVVRPESQQGPASIAANVPLELFVSTSSAAKVRVVADGKVVLDAELVTGENRRFAAKKQFEVPASDSGAVLLELNGNMMAPLGTPGSSGKMILSAKDLRQATGGVTQP
jgi:cytoskeletal protein RodZ